MKLKVKFYKITQAILSWMGIMIIGTVEHKTNIRFEKMDDFESYINAKDIDYDSENVTFTG